MKAIVYTKYGSPDVLQFKEVEKPAPTDGQILVKIYAASANPLDWHLMRASPFLARLAGGLRKPKDPRLGADFAGRVEAVGANVAQFQPGDEVFGASTGAFAEYICVAESEVALKPADLSFEQAAVVPVAATTALQGLRDYGTDSHRAKDAGEWCLWWRGDVCRADRQSIRHRGHGRVQHAQPGYGAFHRGRPCD